MRACPLCSLGPAACISVNFMPPVAQPPSAMQTSIAQIVLTYIVPPWRLPPRRRPGPPGRGGLLFASIRCGWWENGSDRRPPDLIVMRCDVTRPRMDAQGVLGCDAHHRAPALRHVSLDPSSSPAM